MSQYEEMRVRMTLTNLACLGYKYIDHYWTEEGRYPYLVIQSGKLAGFVKD